MQKKINIENTMKKEELSTGLSFSYLKVDLNFCITAGVIKNKMVKVISESFVN